MNPEYEEYIKQLEELGLVINHSIDALAESLNEELESIKESLKKIREAHE